MMDLEHLARLGHDTMLREYGVDSVTIRTLSWESQPVKVKEGWKATIAAILKEVDQAEGDARATVEAQQKQLCELYQALQPVLEFVSRCGLPKAPRQEPDGVAVAVTSGPVMGACLTLGHLRRLAALVGSVNPDAKNLPPLFTGQPVVPPAAEPTFPGNGPVPKDEPLDPATPKEGDT